MRITAASRYLFRKISKSIFTRKTTSFTDKNDAEKVIFDSFFWQVPIEYSVSLDSISILSSQYESERNSEYAFNSESFVVSIAAYDSTANLQYYGVLKRWSGSMWIETKINTYNGTDFIQKPLRFFDGSTFKLIRQVA
jgi:hypothetical protein